MNDTPSIAAQAGAAADESIHTTRRGAHRVVDRLADGAQRWAAQTDHLAHRGADALRCGADQLRERARHAADHTLVHIRQQPMQSVLVAAAVGAAVGLLLALFARPRD